jgi:hypothetical protein
MSDCSFSVSGRIQSMFALAASNARVVYSARPHARKKDLNGAVSAAAHRIASWSSSSLAGTRKQNREAKAEPEIGGIITRKKPGGGEVGV